jgi:Putative Flp pilus-assembly TadE/G-like
MYLPYVTLLMPVLIGVSGLGAEGVMMLNEHRAVQSTADSAAVSVASYHASGASGSFSTTANGVSASYGFVTMANGGTATVTVNNPPLSGNFTTNSNAFEVVVTNPHTPLLSSYWLSSAPQISARAVALIDANKGAGEACALALGKTSGGTTNLPDAITANGNAKLNLTGCSAFSNSSSADAIYYGPKGSASINLIQVNDRLLGSVGTPGGTVLSAASSINNCTDSTCGTSSPVLPLDGAGALPDPYADTSIPSASLASCAAIPSAYQCTSGSNTKGWCFNNVSTPVTLNPGTYCGGISFSKGNTTVTLNPGIYTLASTNGSQGLTDSKGTITMNGTDVTLVFTSADGTYPPASNPIMDVPNDLTLNLTAPTTGATAGFVIMGDRSMPLGTAGQSSSTPTGAQFVVENGATANLNGVVYVPNGAFSFEGNGGATQPCTQFIVNALDLNNSGNLSINCSGGGVHSPNALVGAIPQLVE